MFLLTVFMSIGVSNVFAQGNSNNVFINSPSNINPSSFNTCQGVDTFRFKVLNINVDTILGAKITYSLPVGLNYSSSFISTGFVITELDVSNPRKPVLNIDSILPGENPTIGIVVTSDCGVVGQVTMSNGIRVDDTTKTVYDTITTDSYVPNNPSIITTADIGIIDAKFGGKYSRTFKLEQSGNGFLREVFFERTVGSAYVVDSLHLNGFGSLPFVVIPGSGTVDTIRITIVDTMLVAAGISDTTFDQSDTITITEFITVVDCDGNNSGQAVGYWGCGTNICEKVNPTSVGVLFGAFAPDLIFSYHQADELGYRPLGNRQDKAYNCNQATTRAVLVRNIGTERATNISFDIYTAYPQHNVLDSASFRWRKGISGTPTVFDSVTELEVWNSSSEVSNIYFGGPTPRRYRVHLDNTDIEVGDSIYVQWDEFSFINDWDSVNGIGCSTAGLGYVRGGTRFENMTYSDPCFKLNINEGHQGTPDYHYSRLAMGKGESPLNLFPGDVGTTEYKSTSAILDGWQSIAHSQGAMDSSAYIDFKFTLPLGLDYAGDPTDSLDPAFELIDADSPLKWYPSEIIANDSVVIARYYIAENPMPPGFSWTTNTKLNFSYVADCSEVPPCPGGNPNSGILKEVYAVLDTNCPYKFALDCPTSTDPISVFCNSCNSCDIGIRFTSSDIERSSFGIPDNNNDGRADTTSTGTVQPQDSLDFDNLVLNKYLTGDSITGKYLGVNKTTFGNPPPFDTVPFMKYCYGQLNVPFSEFEVGSGLIRIFDASTSTWHTGTTPKVFKDGNVAYLDGSVDTLLAYTSMTPALPGGFAYDQGDSVYMEIKIGITRILGRTKADEFWTMDLWDSDSVFQTAIDSGRKFNCIPTNINKRRLIQYGFDDYKVSNRYWNVQGCRVHTSYDYYWIYMFEEWFDQFPNEYRHLFDITQWEMQVPEGATLTSLRMDYYNQNPNSTSRRYQFNMPYEFFAGGDSVRMLNVMDSITSGIFGDIRSDGSTIMYVYPRWQLSCESPDNVPQYYRSTYSAQWDTNHFKDIPVTTLNAAGENPYVQSVNSNSSFIFNYQAPKLNSTVGLSIFDAIQKTGVWTVNFANNAPNNADAYNTWFYFDNTINGGQITIDSVKEVSTGTIIPINANGFFELGNLLSLQTRKFEVYASYGNCDLEYIEMYSGYNCPGYFTDIEDMRLSTGGCEAEVDSLGIQPLEALLQATNTVGLDSSDLCDPHQLEYQFTNVQVGHSYNTKITITTPLNSFVDTSNMEIEYPAGGIVYPVSSSDFKFNAPNEYVIYLDSVVPGIKENGLPGPLTSGQNNFKFRYDFELACGFVSGSQIKTNVRGQNPCGSNTNVAAAAPQTIFVYGVPEPYFINPRISSNDFIDICQNNITVRINSLKLGSNAIGSKDTLRLTLPAGLTYVPGSVVFLKNPMTHSVPVITNVGALTLYEWNLPTPVAELDSIDFTIDVNVDLSVDCGMSDIQVQTISDASGNCVGGSSCGVKAQTGTRIKGININRSNLDFIEATASSMYFDPLHEKVTVQTSYYNTDTSRSKTHSISIYSDVNANSVYDDGIDTLIYNTGVINRIVLEGDTTFSTFEFNVPNEYTCALLMEFDSSSCMCDYDFIAIPEVKLINSGVDTLVCVNSSISIGGKSGVGHSYLWSGILPGSSLSDSSLSNPIYYPAAFDTTTVDEIYLTITRAGGCVTIDTFLVTIPVWHIDASSFTPVTSCDGNSSLGSITIHVSDSLGTIPVYSLTGSFTATNNTGYFPNLPEGIYSVKVTNGNCPIDLITDLWLPKIDCDTLYRGIPSIGGTDSTCLSTINTPSSGPYSIGTCDGIGESSSGITLSFTDSCVTYTTTVSPFKGDTACIIICDTITDVTSNISIAVCDTTTMIYYPIPDPDTVVTFLSPGKLPVIVCADVSQLIGTNIVHSPCGGASYGIFNGPAGDCYTYIPVVDKIDTSCVVVCDEFGLCDTTVFIFIPPLTTDTIVTTDTVTCIDTTQVPGSMDSIVTCDGSDLSSGGGDVTIDANGCVTTSPDFGTGITDTTCVIACNTIDGTTICDTTIIIIVKPPTPDTLVILTEGMPVDSCLTQDELPGSTFTYTNCQNPGNGAFNENDDTCFTYVPINDVIDTACVVICDEFGICDTTLFIYIPPVTPDTVITYDTVTCVDTTEIPGMLDSIVTCDGSDLSSGGGNVSIDANGCVTTNPDFGTGVTDTTCIIVCNTIGGFTLCDTTIIIIVKPPTPDTFVIPTGGNPVDTCITQDELPGSGFTYSSCQSPTNGGLNDYNDTCFTYVPVNNELDTTCIVICDELGFCDTTVIIYIPPVTLDTIITTDTVVCVDTTEIPGGVETITGCDGMSPTTSTGGGVATIDANGCVSLSPVFGSGITDTTCIIVCNTIAGIVICDTTIIITVKPTTPDTIIQFTNRTTTDSCITTEELLGANLTYINCGSPNYGTMSNVDSCYKYVPIANKLDTVCTVICDEFGFCDTTVFIYIPPLTPDTVITTDTVVCVDTTEIPGGVGTITGCDGMSPTTSTGGGVATIDANGCVTLSPMFGSGNTDTACIIVCNTVMGIVICDTTIIITVKPPTPDTITQFTNGITTDSCITTEELVGTNLTYINCGSPNYGSMSNADSCYKYIPITNKLDTACTVICDEFGFCDTTIFIYIPPIKTDTVITTDTVVCVDTIEVPGGVETITGCDGMSPTTSTGGGTVTINANGCVSTSPVFGSGNTDTTCILVCNTVDGVVVCDTTIIITVKPPTPDTITQLTNGMTTDSCISTEELVGTNFTYINCGSPNYGGHSNVDSCYKYVPSTNKLDTACTIICDEFGICDTTIFIYIPPVTIDTVITTDTMVCVDTTELPGEVGSITGCDGMSPTTSAGGGIVTIDANGCVTTNPNFGTGLTDTTCIIVCNTIGGVEICDTTIIITIKPPTPDTITQFTNGMTTDSCITTDELLGTNLTYINCGSPNYGTMSNVDSCYKYVPITNELDTSCVIICDEFGVCDTTVFIYIPPVTPDTVITTDTIVCVDTTEIPGGVGTITGCDGMSPTSSAGGGLVTIDANGCVTTSPDFTNGNTDTTCIIVCNTIMGVEICDTTIIITVKPPTPDTITQLTHGMTTDTCLSTSELIGTNYTYVNCGNPVYGVLANNNDSCFTYTPITNELDTSCVIICDEYGICDTTVFIYIPPVTPDTVITTDTIVCVDTTEIPGGVGTITGCDGMSPTSSAGGGLVTIDANGCVTTSPDFTNGNTDTTCIIVCNTIMGVEICDTTIIITVKPPTPDTIIQITDGKPTDTCLSTSELIGTNYTYVNCGNPVYGVLANNNDSCFTYTPITNELDTSCVIICDEYGICDTTVFIYIPPVTPDTVITTDTIVCVDTTEIPGGVGTITGCDGMSPTSSAGGGLVIIDANGCVTTSPDFTNGNTDTTCIIVCNTIMGVVICDTTIIITVKPPTPDTITQFTNGMTTDSCITTDELLGTNLTYINCGSPNYGTMSNVDSCYKYVPITNKLDTACTIICDEYGICDTTVFIYIPPVTPDTVITTDTIVCVDTTEIPGGVGTITGCDGMSPTSSAGGGLVTIDANGCVTTSPDFTNGNTDTTCIIVCNTIMGVEICDTTIIITVKPPTPDTITQLTHGMTTDTCLSTSELIGTNYTYVNCGNPVYGVLANNNDSCFTYTPITNELDTSCVIICDEYGICDTTVFIYIPPVTPDTVITTDTIVCVDTTEIPGGVGTITGCDGMSPTSSAGGGLVTIDANGCVTTSPDFTNGNTDTTCIIVCNTIMGVEICDTTIIITVKPPTPDTIIQITDGKPTDTCLSTSELIGTNYTYVNCGNPVYGVLANNNDSCFTYTPITNELDTSCVIICDEYGICDTTVFIYVPPVTPDTIYTQDSVVCVDTTEMSAGYHTATGCDGMNPTTTSNGGAVTVDARGCATIDPIFGSGVTDTTCIVICDTIFGICDTTIIINKRMSVPDTIYECIPRDGEANDSNMNTNDLLGSIVRTSTIQLPNHGQFTLTDDTNSSYQTSPSPRLDTVTVKIFDKYGCYDMFTFIYIPPMHPDTIKRQGGGIVSVDTTEMPDDRYTSIGTCDGMNMTSNGGTVVPMSGGRVLITPDYTTSSIDTTCVVLCDSILPMCECDTTYIISFKPTIPDTFAILLPKGTNTADTCLSTSELFGKTYSYRRLGAPTPHGPVTTHNDTCINYVQTSTTKYLDTARVLICDECGNCDTTVIVYVPTPDPDTLFLGPVIPLSNADTCVSLESSYMTGMHIGTCDGTGTTSSGVPVAIAGLCVRYPVPPAVFTGDTTCIVVCDTILNITICDTTLIIYLPDTTPPTVICRDDTVYLDATGNVTIDTSNVAGTVYDNTLINSVWVTPTMFNCSHVGANSVMLYARDTNRNMDSCSATITVLDTIAPTAMCQNVTIVLDSMGNASITALTVDAGSFDNCAIASLTVSQTSFDCSHVGVNTVTLTVIDVNGNVSTCTSTVTVEDRIAPIVYCPADKQVILRNTMCTYIVEDFRDEVNLWDNCSTDDIRVTQSPDPGTSVPLDNTSMTVTITATDGSGNASTCTFEVEARCSKDLNIPQFISPTGSGQNDTWEIPELANYPNNTVKVFNRWGNLVFEQKGYYTGWDGSSNVDRGANMLLGENMLPEGTYFYIIDLGEGSGIEPYVGYMQIKR